MAVSTTLKLPEALKKRIAPLAKFAGKTAHAWMVEALQDQAAHAEKRREFITAALAADEECKRTGIAFAGEDVHAYLEARMHDRNTPRPKPVKSKSRS